MFSICLVRQCIQQQRSQMSFLKLLSHFYVFNTFHRVLNVFNQQIFRLWPSCSFPRCLLPVITILSELHGQITPVIVIFINGNYQSYFCCYFSSIIISQVLTTRFPLLPPTEADTTSQRRSKISSRRFQLRACHSV